MLEKNDTLVAEASRYARRFVRPTDGRAVAASTRDVLTQAMQRQLWPRRYRLRRPRRQPGAASASSKHPAPPQPVRLRQSGVRQSLGAARYLASNAGRYRSFGLSYDHVNKNGALVVAWTAEQLTKLPEILHENHRVGDSEAVLLSRDELLEMEPTLSAHALGAVYVPRENVVEPWLVSGANAGFAVRSLIWCQAPCPQVCANPQVPIGFAESARLHGATIELNAEVVGATKGSRAQWLLETRRGQVYEVKVVINCAGLYGDDVRASS